MTLAEVQAQIDASIGPDIAATVMTCMHCERPVEDTVYRCLNCDGAFHKPCLSVHFGGTNGRATTNEERVTHLEQEVEFWKFRAGVAASPSDVEILRRAADIVDLDQTQAETEDEITDMATRGYLRWLADRLATRGRTRD